MINKKILSISAVGILALIFVLNEVARRLYIGQTESTPGSTAAPLRQSNFDTGRADRDSEGTWTTRRDKPCRLSVGKPGRSPLSPFLATLAGWPAVALISRSKSMTCKPASDQVPGAEVSVAEAARRRGQAR